MKFGRKLLNLRRDRKLSAVQLVKACGASPAGYSKLERGVFLPRSELLVRIAHNLCVSCEYLLDERMPYPYEPQNWREKLRASGVDPNARTRMIVTREERAYLEALRRSHKLARKIAYAAPELGMEVLHLVHRIVLVGSLKPAVRQKLRGLLAKQD